MRERRSSCLAPLDLPDRGGRVGPTLTEIEMEQDTTTWRRGWSVVDYLHQALIEAGQRGELPLTAHESFELRSLVSEYERDRNGIDA